MVFTPFEMVTIYNQAANKRKQMQIFCDTEGLTEEQVKKILLDNGVSQKQLPRGQRSDKGKPAPQRKGRKWDPDFREPQGDRPVEDEIIERMDNEMMDKSTQMALPPTAELVIDKDRALQITLDFVRDLFLEKKRLEARLAEIQRITEMIVAESRG